MVRETLRRRVVESKIARDLLCFTIETGLGGRVGRRCRTGGCGLCSRYARAMFAPCSRYARVGCGPSRNGRSVQRSRTGKACAAYYRGMQV